jgi:hypothetical protein
MRSLAKFSEQAGIKGYVKVKVDGDLHWEGPNLVTNVGLAYSATLLGGFAPVSCPAATYDTIDQMIIGNGGADTAGSFSAGLVATPTVPVAPVRTDTVLVSPITNTALLNVGITLAANTVIFDASFQSDTLVTGDFPDFGAIAAAALFVNEFGLLVSGSSSLIARVAVPSIAFAPTSGTTIAVEWTVGYL